MIIDFFKRSNLKFRFANSKSRYFRHRRYVYVLRNVTDTHSLRSAFTAVVARNSRYSSPENLRRCIFRSAGKSAPFLLSQSCNFEPRDGTNSNGDGARNDSRNMTKGTREAKNPKLFKHILNVKKS